MLILEDPSVSVKSRTAIKVLFLYFNLCLCVKLDSSSCSVLTDYMFFFLIVENVLTIDREDDLQVTTISIHDKVSDLGNWLFDTKM